jgi:hypothetical protein
MGERGDGGGLRVGETPGHHDKMAAVVARVQRWEESFRTQVTTPQRVVDAMLAPFRRLWELGERVFPPYGFRIVVIQGSFVTAMKARASDEAGALAAADPLARRVSLKFRDPQAQQGIGELSARHGRRAVHAELQRLLAAEIVVAFAEMTQGEPLPATHAGRRRIMDPGKLFIWEADDWVVGRARSRLVESLRLLVPHEPGDDHHVPVDPRELENPRVLRARDTGIRAALAIDKGAFAAERRALLVIDRSTDRPPVHLFPRLRELAELLARKLRALPPEERALRRTDPAFRAGLAKDMGCSLNALRVYLHRLHAAYDAL